jgi:L-seryl-tRNA(Ser) seleniumtransferase
VNERLRALPGVDRVLAVMGDESAGHARTVAAIRSALDQARAAVLSGAKAPSPEEVAAAARALLARSRRSRLRAVINATGVLIHTNLGRAPLGEAQLEAVRAVSQGYSNLEYDLDRGGRGSRYDHAKALLAELSGAEDALVVNNNAAAVLVVLAALCSGREVVVSRGELIEIGGEFRIPDVMAASGARLVEVGTTNRTHLSDYERALGPETAAVLKVHPSNYKIVGFTRSVAARDLARLARGRGVPFVYDLGSGYAGSPQGAPVPDEPRIDAALQDGADVVTFSGDKLLGGPQAGVICGRAELIATIARHPLMRALRVDKMTLAALEATLDAHLSGHAHELPLWRLAAASVDGLAARAAKLVAALQDLGGLKAEAVPSAALTGGGSWPGAELPSYAVALAHAEKSPDELARALRAGDPPVIGRIENERVVLDLRTVPDEQDDALSAALRAALG